MSKRFNTHALAAEELVAEIGASILGAHLGLPPDHLSDHASYVSHWMNLLKDDKRAFLAAAAQAQTAVDWLLDKAGARPRVAADTPASEQSRRSARDGQCSVR
jgi:antirestriction protein ArdC